ncbi:MAG: hypothetical protein LQ342_004759 [Letrouitia transgressa]|nr:MAG: hypothetical protein LQ342_004759 [Letrouitia transgressa]
MSNTNISRIWEHPGDHPPSKHTSQNAQLPSIATLTNSLPSQANGATSSPTYPSHNRDSDQWPSQPQSTSKPASFPLVPYGSSAYSSGLNNFYASSLGSPHRASNSSQLGATSHPVEYNKSRGSAGPQPSPAFAPQQNLGLPAINQHHESSQYRDSQDFPPQESRRSSIGSQVNNGFTNLHLNGASSPYAGSTNQSQTSITTNLQRERGITPIANGVRNSRTSGTQPLSPLAPYPGESRQAFSTRTAPIISANPMREVYNADKPTAGQPYAFPDPDLSQPSSASADDPRSATTLSRRDSDHASVASSVFTTDSRQPRANQRTADGDKISATHHHTLQHRQVSQLTGESDSPDATSPYSRTPALRASHKMAERKRRTEMKYLFDSLRSQIPASHGSKSSKWEILSKASEYIKSLENTCKANQAAHGQLNQAANELEIIKRENESLRNENQRLYHEMNVYRETSRNMVQPPMPPHYGGGPVPMATDPSRSLPPLTNGVHASSMQGVQYTDGSR